jgi:hypothetical protein
MFEKTLVRGAKTYLALLGKSRLLDDAYLAGGTAAALHLGHRLSIDFDFFTTKAFEPQRVVEQLAALGKFVAETAEKGTVFGNFEGVKFSLFLYPYSVLFPFQVYLSLKVADLRDIAAMKLQAISARGLKRDFIDLYFICQGGQPLREVFDFYQQKYGKLSSNLFHLQKSLVYFEDAEIDEMPQMLKPASWNDIKAFFEAEVKKL